MSSVFRFHGPTEISGKNCRKVLKKRRHRKKDEPFLIAADSSTFTVSGGTNPIHTYRDLASVRWVTLTRREADLIAFANPGERPPEALEDLYPWLPSVAFVNDSKDNFRNLNSIVRSFGTHLILARDFCDAKWNTVCNATRTKNDLDARFYTAWHLPIQDAYMLEERRPDRNVIAVDFNAMYPACMQHEFPKPSNLRQMSYGRAVGSDESLPLGLYRCILQNPSSEFIKKYNPFCSFFSGRYLRTKLDEPVEVDLNEFEIEFFQRHFQTVYLVDAVISDRGIQHPLAREVRRSFARRMHYKSQGNKPLADREKYLSTLMSSCTARPNRLHKIFGTRALGFEFLKAQLGINPRLDEPESAVDFGLRRRKGLSATETSRGLSVESPDLFDGSAIFLFGQRIVARSRVTLLEMMEDISSKFPEVEICYTNIDSIHFSLPAPNLADALQYLGEHVSDELGALKIEAVTRHGLWLEPGRYWLYSETVAKFRNRSVGDQRLAFKDHAIHVASRKIDELYIPIRTTIRMDRTMSDAWMTVEDTRVGVTRLARAELGSSTAFAEILEHLEGNRNIHTPKRLCAFEALKSKVGVTSTRCLGTK